MEMVAPGGPVYQAGTLSGNPVAMTAGLWALKRLTPGCIGISRHEDRCWPLDWRRRRATQAWRAGQRLRLAAHAVLHLDAGARLSVGTGREYQAYGAFFRGMLKRGVYPPPSQFEAWFLSAAHTDSHVRKTIAAARGAMKDVAKATS
jgi:glutamate-1-semialdehyde 2,1-aminomutase